MGKEGYKGELNDSVIIVVGPTGSGKTNLINILTGNAKEQNTGALKPDTKSVTPYIVPFDGPVQLPGRLVLVDTPGFDEAYQPDTMVLRHIFDGLKVKYSNDTLPKLTGIIYLHRITDNRVPGSIYKDPQVFRRLCGNIPLCRARLVTTMWDDLRGRHQEVAETRERELINDFWGPLLKEGAATKRFDNTSASALEIIGGLLRQSVGEAIQ